MYIIELLKVIILGTIEGITEWLPISSTGHLILVDELIKLSASDAFKEMFNVVIQLGSIMAVVVIYFEKLNPFSKQKSHTEKQATVTIWKKVIIGSIPAVILGLLIDDYMDLYFNNSFVIACALIFYGVWFIIIERKHKHVEPSVNDLAHLSYATALKIGLFQCLSLIPGTSRSGTTILGGLIVGASRFVATEFSFFMGIPIMFGASGLKLLKFGLNFTGMELLYLAVGCVTAFGVSIVVIRLLIGYLKTNDFQAFGWYRIFIGTIILVWSLLK